MVNNVKDVRKLSTDQYNNEENLMYRKSDMESDINYLHTSLYAKQCHQKASSTTSSAYWSDPEGLEKKDITV